MGYGFACESYFAFEVLEKPSFGQQNSTSRPTVKVAQAYVVNYVNIFNCNSMLLRAYHPFQCLLQHSKPTTGLEASVNPRLKPLFLGLASLAQIPHISSNKALSFNKASKQLSQSQPGLSKISNEGSDPYFAIPAYADQKTGTHTISTNNNNKKKNSPHSFKQKRSPRSSLK